MGQNGAVGKMVGKRTDQAQEDGPSPVVAVHTES